MRYREWRRGRAGSHISGNGYNKASSSQCETPWFSAHRSLATLLIMRRVSRPRPPPSVSVPAASRIIHHPFRLTDLVWRCHSRHARLAAPLCRKQTFIRHFGEFSAARVFLMEASPFQMLQRLLVVSGGSTATVTPSAAPLPSFSFIPLDQVFA